MNDYPPLALLAQSNQPNREFISRKQQFMSYGCKNLEKMTPDDYIEYFLSSDFYNPLSNHKYKDITTLLMLNEKDILYNAGIDDQLESGACEPVTEWKDIYLAPVLHEEWSKSKQVYKPDADFADALLNTDKFELTTSMIKHLPCENFYIDLSGCKEFGSIAGVFTYIRYNEKEKKVSITLYLLTNELVYFSFYISGYFDEKGLIKLDLNEIEDRDYVIWSPAFLKEKTSKIKNEDLSMSRRSVYVFALQMIAYLSIDEPQLDESDLTKKTYNPKSSSSKPKNKWSEVHIQDVGIRYGKAFRKQINELREVKDNSNEMQDGDKQRRKSPIPHFRCAHWHKYWTGTGRTECKLRWIEPVFVGDGKSSDAVIHVVH